MNLNLDLRTHGRPNEVVKLDSIKLVRKNFNAALTEQLTNCVIGFGSGMQQWCRRIQNPDSRSWVGHPPKRVTLVYAPSGEVAGWCGIGEFNETYDLVGTYVRYQYRGQGLAIALLNKTLKLHPRPEKILLIDNYQWDITKYASKHNIKTMSIWSVADVFKAAR